MHLCFGYAAVVRKSPPATASSPSSPTAPRTQISIEAAQPKLDLGVLRDLAGKTIMLGVLDLGDPAIETPETVAARIRDGASLCRRRTGWSPAPDCGMKYLPRAIAFGKLRALADGAAIVRAELEGRARNS